MARRAKTSASEPVRESARSPMERTSTSDQAACIVRERILRGELARGATIHELALANSLGISRNTMREAVRVLVREGLVRHNLHRGLTVSVLTETDIADIFRARVMLETSAVEGARTATRAELLSLQNAVDAVDVAVASGDGAEVVQADLNVHRRIVALLRSQRLNQHLEALIAELRLGLLTLDHDRKSLDDLRAKHQQMLTFLTSGRYREAANALKAHLAESERHLRAAASGQDPARLKGRRPRAKQT